MMLYLVSVDKLKGEGKELAITKEMSKYLISKKIRHVLEFDQMKYTAYRKKRK